jgi:heme-degrading monooxygenase HmoA
MKSVEMGEKVIFYEQMEEGGGPVILINKFNMNPEDIDEFQKIWGSAAQIWKKLPGFISAQLHRGIAGSSVFLVYVVFESPKLLKQAFNNADFQSKISEYPASVVASPHLIRKVAVPGICVD